MGTATSATAEPWQRNRELGRCRDTRTARGGVPDPPTPALPNVGLSAGLGAQGPAGPSSRPGSWDRSWVPPVNSSRILTPSPRRLRTSDGGEGLEPGSRRGASTRSSGEREEGAVLGPSPPAALSACFTEQAFSPHFLWLSRSSLEGIPSCQEVGRWGPRDAPWALQNWGTSHSGYSWRACGARFLHRPHHWRFRKGAIWVSDVEHDGRRKNSVKRE